MASPQRRAQKPRVLFVPAGTAPARVATLAHSPAAEITSYTPGKAHRRTSPITQLTIWISRSLPRLPRSLRGTTPLLGAAATAGTAPAGRFAVYQRGLAHGSARPLDRLERLRAPVPPTVSD